MAFLRSTGAAVPERVVTNDELAPLIGEPAAWIEQVSGILQRRYAAEGETVVSQGTLAAERCLQAAALTPADVGMLLVSSGSADRFCPGPASSIAAALGFTSTPALDLPVGSAGSLIALGLAMRLAPTVGNVLVIGSEVMSRRVHATPEGRNTAILFGDAAAAALVSPAEGFLRLHDAVLYTDGTGADVLSMEPDGLHMDGGSVILRASRKMPAAIRDVLARNGLQPDAVAHLLLHQANLNLLNKVAAALSIPQERMFTNIARYGNTSSASLLLALHDWAAQTARPVSGPVVFSAFGMGLNWGALLALPA